jgi:hypothetical protein
MGCGFLIKIKFDDIISINQIISSSPPTSQK